MYSNCNGHQPYCNRCAYAGTDCCRQQPVVQDNCYYMIEDHGMQYAKAYVKYQRYENVYDAKQALCRGTAFQDLDMPCW